MDIRQIKNVIQSSHINFLFGSGLSMPYIQTLGNIETLLTKAETIEDRESHFIMQTLLRAKYFNDVMLPCIQSEIVKRQGEYDEVLNNYKTFLSSWNKILANRNVGLLDKKINIFTTNIDNFTEIAAEQEGIEFNDGFKGHINPIYREDSFSNIVSRTSSLYHNSSMIPMFNLMKLHGSINWTHVEKKQIGFSKDLSLIEAIKKKTERTFIPDLIQKISGEETLGNIQSYMKEHPDREKEINDSLSAFKEKYDELIIVNPHKSKFRETVLELHFYELMRLLSNSLESSSALLIVSGFSFADEHIAKIIIRSANTNPTLLILVFAYDKYAEKEIKDNLAKMGNVVNNNLTTITPETYKSWFDTEYVDGLDELAKFDFSSLNKYVFCKISEMTN